MDVQTRIEKLQSDADQLNARLAKFNPNHSKATGQFSSGRGGGGGGISTGNEGTSTTVHSNSRVLSDMKQDPNFKPLMGGLPAIKVGTNGNVWGRKKFSTPDAAAKKVADAKQTAISLGFKEHKTGAFVHPSGVEFRAKQVSSYGKPGDGGIKDNSVAELSFSIPKLELKPNPDWNKR